MLSDEAAAPFSMLAHDFRLYSCPTAGTGLSWATVAAIATFLFLMSAFGAQVTG